MAQEGKRVVSPQGLRVERAWKAVTGESVPFPEITCRLYEECGNVRAVAEVIEKRLGVSVAFSTVNVWLGTGNRLRAEAGNEVAV